MRTGLVSHTRSAALFHSDERGFKPPRITRIILMITNSGSSVCLV
jgi:hypothetical protein